MPTDPAGDEPGPGGQARPGGQAAPGDEPAPGGQAAPGDGAGLGLGSRRGRTVLLATILGSGMAQLDGTVVNVALPRIGRDLDAGLTALQWTVNAYSLTLSGLLLLGGSLGDRLGRRRVFTVGVVWFALASAGCAAAPNEAVLIAMRALQGVGAALLTPGSLAIIQSAFARDDRAAAVGTWSGLGGIAGALGPVVGGLLVGAAPWGWRLVFLINLPLAVLTLVAARAIPEARDRQGPGHLDVVGAVLAALGLGGIVYALTEGPAGGWPVPTVGIGALGAALLVAFVLQEIRHRDPLVPPVLFASRDFTATNAVTLAVYAALGGAFFLLPLQLQDSVGFSPVAAGSALLPITVLLLVLSGPAGRLSTRIGPRLPMTVGPLVAGLGLALFTRVGPGAGYVRDVLPAVLVFGLGLSLTVAPLTATVMASVADRYAGVASAVNNDVARTAGLLAVAVLPALAGIATGGTLDPARLSAGFDRAVLIAAGLCIAGGVIAALTVTGRQPSGSSGAPGLRGRPSGGGGS